MEEEKPILHVIVVGFHHKKGCQVEYSYPPLEGDIEKTAWKYLPTLAMPDGAHNYDRDTVYFHLPSLKDSRETVFGVACYQQISADLLKIKTDDVTRSSVQKSVCILSRWPLFGHIQVKMELITAAYFREGDFSQISLLEKAYHNLNDCLSKDQLDTSEAFQGLSARDLVFTFGHQVLILLKLLLLERKVLFRGPSVGPMCSALLTLVSLLPDCVCYGLQESACVRTAKQMSIVPDLYEHGDIDTTDDAEVREENMTAAMRKSSSVSSTKSMETSELEKNEEVPDFLTAVNIKSSEAGLPLQIFTNGYLCHPYLSLHYMDLLSDRRVRGFLVGATNVLFKQKRNLCDAVIEVKDGTIEISDPALKRLVTLTTPDLRFAESIVRQVGVNGEQFMDGVGWEGGDEWTRAQFKYYLMCLMRTSLTEPGHRSRESFGTPFMDEWQKTCHWKTWQAFVTSEDRETPGVYALCPGHPNDGNISISDMKLKLSHAIHNTEGGRRLKSAMTSTSVNIVNTSKVFGDALQQAKLGFSSWFGSTATAASPSTTPTTSQPQGPEFSSSIVPEQEST